jgi:hypothetical protein
MINFSASKIALKKHAINKRNTDKITYTKITVPENATLELLQIQRVGGVSDLVEFDI